MTIICPSGTSGSFSVGNSINEFCPTPANPAYFYTELILNGNLVIPPQKPPKKHIVKVTHDVTLRDVEVLTVERNGVTLGNKIIVSGTVKLHIQYVADVLDQKVHYVHYDLPFNAIVVGDCDVGLIPVEDVIFPNNFVVHVCVEKLRITQINPRTLSKEIVLMVWIEQKQ